MPHFFGVGRGHLSNRVEKAAHKEGAELVNYTDPGCSCGYGCHDDCPENRRHWFECENLGEPFNSETARRVLAAVAKVATTRDRLYLDS